MNTRTIHAVADLSAFLKEQDQSLPVVLLVRDDFAPIIDTASYECHRIVLTPSETRSSTVAELEDEIAELERDIERLENNIEDLETENIRLENQLKALKK